MSATVTGIDPAERLSRGSPAASLRVATVHPLASVTASRAAPSGPRATSRTLSTALAQGTS